jgi:hypothetical protein
MRTKSYIKLLLIGAILFLGGCENSGFLQESPYSFTSPVNYYKTPLEMETALTGAYELVCNGNGGYGNQLKSVLDPGTDELVVALDLAVDEGLYGKNSFTSEVCDYLKNTWANYFQGINRCNYILDNLKNVANEENAVQMLRIESEAKFLRSWYTLQLSLIFGGLPFVDHAEVPPSLERSSVETIYTQIIIPGFQFAYENLSETSNLAGRANKYTAAGYLAYTYNYLASAKMNNLGGDLNFPLNSFEWVDANDFYTKSKLLCEEIINSKKYQLIPQYAYLFRENTKSYQYKEFLFNGEASSSGETQYIGLINGFIPQGKRDVVGGGYGYFRPTIEMWKLYGAQDIRGTNNITANIPPEGAPKEYIEGVPYYVPNALTTKNLANISVGKWRYIDPALKIVPNWAGTHNLPLLRFAEIYLLYAEAIYYTGDELNAREQFKPLRLRAANYVQSDADQLTAAYHKDDFLEELLDERARELCFESKRRFDLFRFNKYEERLGNINPNEGKHNAMVTVALNNWAPYKIWFPIPLKELNLNHAMIQNPGY